MKTLSLHNLKVSLSKWNYPRALQFIIGLFVAISGIVEYDIATIVVGVLFAGLALLNVGCGALSGNKNCSIDEKTSE